MTFKFADDYWISKDKRDHFLGSALLVAVFYFLCYHFSWMCQTWAQKDIALFWALFCGFFWEVKDGFFTDGFSYKDLVADLLGAWAMWFLAV